MEFFQSPWKPSRLWQPTDATFLSSRTFYAGTRPRGVLSGLFVITDPSTPAQFHSISGTIPVRMRLNDSFYADGQTVLLAYEHDDHLMLEDVLVWKGKEVWSCETFQHRWNYFKQFLMDWMPDRVLQGYTIDIASYTMLEALTCAPPEGFVLEFIPNQARQKRLIVLLEAEAAPVVEGWTAVRESARGPDVYSVMKSGSTTSEGIACVQSLTVSRALRTQSLDTFPVRCQWHERFKKWEIVEVL